MKKITSMFTFCKYLKAVSKGEQYDHKQHTEISAKIMKKIKLIFQDLGKLLLHE